MLPEHNEALLQPGDALHEVVEADPALFIAESDGDGAEDAAVEAEPQCLQRRSKLVQVEVSGPVDVHAFEHVEPLEQISPQIGKLLEAELARIVRVHHGDERFTSRTRQRLKIEIDRSDILKDLGEDGFQFKGINFKVVAGNGFEKFVKLGIFLLLFVVVLFLDRKSVV